MSPHNVKFSLENRVIGKQVLEEKFGTPPSGSNVPLSIHQCFSTQEGGHHLMPFFGGACRSALIRVDSGTIIRAVPLVTHLNDSLSSRSVHSGSMTLVERLRNIGALVLKKVRS